MRRQLAAMLLFVSGQAVSAQIPSSSQELRGGIPVEKDYVQGAVELRRLAECGLRRNRSYARSMLNSLPGSDTEARVGMAMLKVMEPCMNDFRPAMRVDFAQLRGALAEAAYAEGHPTLPNFAGIDHSGQALPAEWLKLKLTPYQVSEVVAQDFAQCVVSNAPEQSDAILRTEPRSQEASKAIGAITPFLGPCLVQGRTFKMDAAAVRSYVAQALYRGMAMWPVRATSGGN